MYLHHATDSKDGFKAGSTVQVWAPLQPLPDLLLSLQISLSSLGRKPFSLQTLSTQTLFFGGATMQVTPTKGSLLASGNNYSSTKDGTELPLIYTCSHQNQPPTLPQVESITLE